MTDLKATFSEIYNNWGFGGYPDSRSGPGSTLGETDNIRKEIRNLIDRFKIKTVVDLPCGDFNWMKEIVYGFEHYMGCDIVPEVIVANKKYSNEIIEFREFDLTGDEPIPEADLLIVRDVIGHLPLEMGKKALQNILNSKCKYLLSTTWYNKNDLEYYKKHSGNREVDTGRFYPVCLLSEPFNLPSPEFYIEEAPVVDEYDSGNRKGLGFWDLTKIRNNFNKDITVVTGLWDIQRTGRSFDVYIENFKKFLEIPVNMFIYVPKDLEYLVWQNPNRTKSNTHVRIFELHDLKNLYAPFWETTQNIRNSERWQNQTGEHGWLKNSPQAKNLWYNPIVQSKMFMLHDAKIMNFFNTDYFLWMDAGISGTVDISHFTDNKCLDKIVPYLKTFLFLSYPYEASTEIHGFDYTAMNRYARQEVKYVCRGGLFGGHKDFISVANSSYYHLLNNTLSDGYMGTEESIFSIMSYLEPHIYRRYALDGNGLIGKFTQALIDNTVELENFTSDANNKPKGVYNQTTDKTSLYVLSFNFPEQFEALVNSLEKHHEWLEKPRKILINNSQDAGVISKYENLCQRYGFEHIVTGENLGINRGRLFAAEHFQESDSSYYFFFEDDMMLHPSNIVSPCRNGFRQYVPNLYKNVHEIMAKEEFDFLKLSFSEVYMDNNIQVSWYNVPQAVRTEIWPEYDKLPSSGLDPYAPRTRFDRIDTHDGLSYITGDIYYANWPMIVSKKGNYKMFLETKWERPFEQTWMSYMFQETRKKNINPAVLLASPINHNRISHYTPEERREN